MSLPIGIAKFIIGILPDVVKLFRKHNGNVETARRDLRSLVDEISADRAAVDAEIKRQRENE